MLTSRQAHRGNHGEGPDSSLRLSKASEATYEVWWVVGRHAWHGSVMGWMGKAPHFEGNGMPEEQHLSGTMLNDALSFLFRMCRAHSRFVASEVVQLRKGCEACTRYLYHCQGQVILDSKCKCNYQCRTRSGWSPTLTSSPKEFVRKWISVSVHDTKHCCPDLFWTLLASVRYHRHASIKGHVSKASIMAQHEVKICSETIFALTEMTPGAFDMSVMKLGCFRTAPGVPSPDFRRTNDQILCI